MVRTITAKLIMICHVALFVRRRSSTSSAISRRPLGNNYHYQLITRNRTLSKLDNYSLLAVVSSRITRQHLSYVSRSVKTSSHKRYPAYQDGLQLSIPHPNIWSWGSVFIDQTIIISSFYFEYRQILW